MDIKHRIVVFDTDQLGPESRFWAGVLGGTVDVEDVWHMVVVDGKPVVGVQLAPNHTPPDWPDGSPQQIHLDLWVEDIVSARATVTELGARVLQAATDDDTDRDAFEVYADPAGHPFCLCWVKDE